MFDNLKIGYDNNADDDIDDAGDDVVLNEDFGGTSITYTHDDNGNLTDDGRFKYTFDAWNRMVKVTASNDTDVTLQTAEYDGKGRRMKKVVTKSGPLDSTVVYLYDGWKICETQNGSDVMVQQFIHGTQYIDELVMVRVKDKGDLYVHQDANWNVVALTDLGTHLVERYVYTPYGELIVEQETSFGDRDGDADVDSTDKGTPGSTCTGTVTAECRILDLDFDGDYDSTDAGLFDSLPQGIARHPGRASTGVDQPFAHQGLLYDAEITQYQNRHRQYDPAKRRFLQRDPLGPDRSFFVAELYYHEGLNLYGYLGAAPLNRADAQAGSQCGGTGPWHPTCCITDYLWCRDYSCCPIQECVTCFWECWNCTVPNPCHACGCCGINWLLCNVPGGNCPSLGVQLGCLAITIQCWIGGTL